MGSGVVSLIDSDAALIDGVIAGVDLGGDGSVVRRSRGDIGIQGSGNRVEQNLFSSIVAGGAGNILRQNRPSRGRGWAPTAGIALVGATRTLVERNSVANSSGPCECEGILVDDSADTGNVIRGNLVSGYGYDGILIGSLATLTLLESNDVFGNGNDGIEVRNATAAIRGNFAHKNGNLGIEAIAGVTDAGGNRARGNGNPAQCVGVTCH